MAQQPARPFRRVRAFAWVGMPLTAVLLVFIINAVNLIDGIDGLASGLSMIALFFLGCLYGFCGNWTYAVLSFATLGTLVPFFIYNVVRAREVGRKIFMGDCGSQTIGLILGLLAVRFCVYDSSIGALASIRWWWSFRCSWCRVSMWYA